MAISHGAVWMVGPLIYMGESFQDYSWIQDFEADSIESQSQIAEFKRL